MFRFFFFFVSDLFSGSLLPAPYSLLHVIHFSFVPLADLCVVRTVYIIFLFLSFKFPIVQRKSRHTTYRRMQRAEGTHILLIHGGRHGKTIFSSFFFHSILSFLSSFIFFFGMSSAFIGAHIHNDILNKVQLIVNGTFFAARINCIWRRISFRTPRDLCLLCVCFLNRTYC